MNCKNFKICKGEDHANGYCMECYWKYHYKMLEIKNINECPVCLDEGIEGVKYLNCSHFVCIPCYKKQLYPKTLERTCEPSFPYDSDVEERYGNDQENPKWERDYPLIKQYNKDRNQWDDKWGKKENEIVCQLYSDKCSICRAPATRNLQNDPNVK